MSDSKRVEWRDDLIRGDVVYVKLSNRVDSCVQSGIRPCVIVSNNISNRNARIVNVCPLTSKVENRSIPVHVKIEKNEESTYLNKTSILLAEQIVTVDKKQIMSLAGNIGEDTKIMEAVNSAIMRQLGIENVYNALVYRGNLKQQENDS